MDTIVALFFVLAPLTIIVLAIKSGIKAAKYANKYGKNNHHHHYNNPECGNFNSFDDNPNFGNDDFNNANDFNNFNDFNNNF